MLYFENAPPANIRLGIKILQLKAITNTLAYIPTMKKVYNFCQSCYSLFCNKVKGCLHSQQDQAV